LGERPRDDGGIEILKARTRSIIDLVLYFEDLLEGNDDSGLTVEEKLHRLSYKMQRGEEKYLEMWGVRVDCESTSCPVGGEKREKVSSVGPGASSP
jgi:hypothetical protein